MHRKTLAGLSLVLASAAACGTARQPVAAPAPAPAPEMAPPPAPVETVAPVEEGFALRGAPAAIGADLLGSVQYDLPMQANEWVRMELEFLVHQRHSVVAGWLRNAERYGEFAREVFASYGLPRDLYHLAMIESGFRPTVRSHAGAVGMWQFMPATGRGMGLRIDDLVDERMDPVRSTHAAARHLRDLHRRFRGDWSLAAAAYNAGEGRINRGLGRFGARDFWELAQRGDLAQETRHYVPRLYATTIIARDPVRFGYPAPNPARRFVVDSIRVDLQTPLAVLATVGNLPLNELTELNPHLIRQTAPRGYTVWVPAGQGPALQQAFHASEFRQRGGYATYQVREGDSLTRLAEVSGLSAETIRSLNLSVGTEALRPGTSLRLYADAARVLNARPVQRVARSEPARRPRVLGDPESDSNESAPASASSSGSSERRTESSSASRSGSASGERRSGGSSSASSASGQRTGSAAVTERSSGSSSASSSSERRSGSGTATASEERRSGTSGAASSERRSGTSGSAGAERSSGSAERASGSSASRTSAAGRTHEVADGETLWGIARRYDVTVEAVREANEMENETIRPGQTLRIPRASSGASNATASSARTESGSSRPAASGARPSAERAPGSSSGSRPAGSSASGERASTSSSTRTAAERPSSSSSSSTSSSRPAASGGRAAARTREHTVGDGETLWGIARRYETTVDSLRRANDLDADEQIRPGQKLTIPES